MYAIRSYYATRIYQLLFIFSLLTGVGFFWLFVSKQNREELLALQINASEVWSRRMPADKNCLQCHSVHPVGRERMEIPGDVHAAAGLSCTDCHP